jgi:hypothetical protein
MISCTQSQIQVFWSRKRDDSRYLELADRLKRNLSGSTAQSGTNPKKKR